MRILKNRITLSLFVILALAYVWEFHFRPMSSPLYTSGVEEYRSGDYERALELLEKAYRIDPNNTALLTLFGWTHLKLGDASAALPYFERALRLDPRLQDAREGVAYSRLETGDYRAALSEFDRLNSERKKKPNIGAAQSRAYRRLGENRKALQIVLGVLDDNPEHELARRELEHLTGSDNPEIALAVSSPSPPRPVSLQMPARLREGYFEVRQEQDWKRIYVAGVNVSAGVPGRFASDPLTDFRVYLGWMNRIGEMGANSIRVYTILPPAFYRALLLYNLKHPNLPLYLFQEIWLELPPNDNLFHPEFTADFLKEMRDAVDVVHGRADLPFRRGHAGGIYTADVSPYVLGWLVGREVEPRVVITTNLRNPGVDSFTGRYLKISRGNPTEVWLTERCDYLTEYEMRKYNWQHPVAFVNWPPLDPLHHPTEASLREELRIRRARGEPLAPLGLGIPDDNDTVSLDEEKVIPQPDLQAGYFALYHIYPFYPDFLLLDKNYLQAQDSYGPNSYWGYLEKFRRHFQRTPVLVGEYGLSTSVGIAHFNPNGWNHGGLSEDEQGVAMARLTRNIRDAGFAGGIVFEWIDEWWKRNWIAVDFEKPFERSPLWHNEMNPEQSFGIMKYLPETPPVYSSLDSAPEPAEGEETLPVRDVKVASDPGALYVDLELNPAVSRSASMEVKQQRIFLALNTCGGPCGSGRLPGLEDVTLGFGANFVASLALPLSSDARLPDAHLLIADSYNPYQAYTPIPSEPYTTDIAVARSFQTFYQPDGSFEEFIVQTNRRRYGRNGTFYPGRKYSRSLLRYGVFDPSHPDFDSLGQWYFDREASRIRLRLSWGLLLVLDPSAGRVFAGTDAEGKVQEKISDRIELAVVVATEGEDGIAASPVQIIAGAGPGNQIVKEQIAKGQIVKGRIANGMTLPWPTWSAVRYREVPKRSYRHLAEAFSRLTGRSAGSEVSKR